LAKAGYNNALTIKPAEGYPKNRIAEIDKLIIQQQQALSKETGIRMLLLKQTGYLLKKNMPIQNLPIQKLWDSCLPSLIHDLRLPNR